LDPELQAILERLTQRLGWTPSRVLREGLRLMDRQYASSPKKKIIGLGEFDAGPTDLATNKKHMKGFGRW
jgi:hypothetical protein